MLGYLSSCRQYVARRFVHVGCTAAASDLAEQMVQYVRSSCADNPQQALDVLQSGLTAVGGDQEQRARLYLAMAEVHIARSKWTAALDAYSSCTQEAVPGHPTLVDGHLGATRALTVLGRDHDVMDAARAACSAADAIAEGGAGTMATWRYSTAAAAASLTALHATAAWPDADGACAATMNDPSAHDAMVTTALLTIATHWLAKGELQHAATWVTRAVNAAAQAAQQCSTSQGDATRSPVLAQHAAADARLLRVQLLMRQGDLQAAEGALGTTALPAVEAAWGERGPAVALPLLLMAEIYRRGGRVVLAEGLYRECLRLCGMPKEAGSIPDSLERLYPTPTHVSIPGLAAWRLAQVLHALPNRSTEVERFAHLAKQLGCARLGSLDAFVGAGGNKGVVPVLSSWSLRAWTV